MGKQDREQARGEERLTCAGRVLLKLKLPSLHLRIFGGVVNEGQTDNYLNLLSVCLKVTDNSTKSLSVKNVLSCPSAYRRWREDVISEKTYEQTDFTL